jgi:hypothetical protein
MWLLALGCVAIASVALPSSFMVAGTESTRNEVLGFMTMMNFIDLLLFALISAVAMFLFLHHLLWHSISRPLYFFQREGVLARKEFARGLGVIFLSAGLSVNGRLLGPAFEYVKNKIGM